MINSLHCSQLSGVGPQTAKKLAKLGIETAQDLLFFLPFRYQDRSHITPIRKIKLGKYAVIEGIILSTATQHSKRKTFVCNISDGCATLTLRFFNCNYRQQISLSRPHLKIRCYGEVRFGGSGLEMFHPEYQILSANKPAPLDQTLTPIYPTTEGLSQNIIRKLTQQALALLQQHPLPELLPKNILKQFKLPELNNALNYIHRPPVDADQQLLEQFQHSTQQRLIFEELLAHQIALRHLRRQLRASTSTSLPCNKNLFNRLLDNLPFSLTMAQQRVIQEIKHDLPQKRPMLRLIQGDVGSGKTIVACAAILQALENGYQAAIMAPTELLAEQHYQNFCNWLEPLKLTVVWLSGKVTGKARTTTLQQISDGSAQLVVGTHALFQKQVEFANLALIIIDEQHRFGVHQRLALREKGTSSSCSPHQLIMTATPIPRTLAMLAYSDLDCSIIDELPPGRTPVTTVMISNQRRHEVLDRVSNSCHQGQQTYWVCPLISESEHLQCQAAEITAEQLQQSLPELNIALLHGKMKPDQKQQVMRNFKQQQIDILVATTVIEVGVDVPNASLMIIENAERLGVAQLHQLRGRVGRGTTTSYCVLMYQSPLSIVSKQRLLLLREINDGFVLAQKDLEMRGPGELLGTRQTGLLQMRIADITRDQELLEKTQCAADIILQQHPSIAKLLQQRWIGNREHYAAV